MEQFDTQFSSQPARNASRSDAGGSTPNPKGIKLFWFALAIIITAIVAGGAVYLWQNNVVNKLASNFQKQTIDLSNKILEQKGSDNAVWG